MTTNTAPTFTVSDGKVLTDFGSATLTSADTGRSLGVQADGKIVMAGFANNAFELVRYNTDGSLDTGFGTAGKVSTTWGTTYSYSQANSVSIQGDGKIVVAGESNGNFAIARYNADGTLDSGFGTAGKVTTAFPPGGSSSGQGLTVQADGKIVVVGSIYMGGQDFAVARYNANGTLDTSFDVDGTLSTDFGSYEQARSVVVQADSKILVSGSSSGQFVLARYNADGSLDTGFDTDGKLTTDFGGNDQFINVALQADGKILVAGSGGSGFIVARYKADGSLDTTFGTDGKATVAMLDYASGSSVAVQADGKILLAGSARSYSDAVYAMALLRLNANGSIDTSFDNDGKAFAGFAADLTVSSLRLQADGKILVGGTSSGDFAVARFNADGSLDTSFSAPENTLDATPVYNEGYYYNSSYGVVLDANVQIFDAELSAAKSYEGASLTLARHDGASEQDVFSARNGGPLSALVPGSYFSVDSITIGKVTTNSGGTLVLTFTAGATQALVDRAMQQIVYANSSDAPPLSVQVDWTFNDGNSGKQGDGGAASIVGHTTVKIIPTNDNPVANGVLAPIAVQPNVALNYTIPSTAFSDPDGDVLIYAVTMTNGTGLPPWLKFDAATRTFSGTPGVGDAATLALTLRVTDAAGVYITSALTLTVAETNDAPTGSVTIAGTPTQGGVLTAANTLADADGLGAIVYQWKAGGTAIASATGASLTLTEGQVGKQITVTATYRDGNGTVEAVTSSPTTAVANLNDIGAVIISGPPARGRVLSATASDADGLGAVSYQWHADGVAIANATGATLALADAQVGKAITVTASYTDGHGTVESVTSAATRAVADGNVAPTGAVTIAGVAAQGQVLSAANTLADADGLGTVHYQWRADGSAIKGATAASFTLTEAEVGKAMTVAASYTDGNGNDEVIASGATAVVANVNDAGTVSIAGVAAFGRVLSAKTVDADGVGTVSYQWKADNVDIAGATGATLTLGDGQLGKKISVAASYTDGHGTAEALVSGATAAVGHIANTAPTFTVSDGKLTTRVDGTGSVFNEAARSAAVQADGKLLVSGGSGDRLALVRYNADGSLDTGFHTDGKATIAFDVTPYSNLGYSVATQADGKIVVGGQAAYMFGLARFNADGSLDTTFDGDGKVTTAFDSPSGYARGRSVAIQADGKIVMAGFQNTNSGNNGNDFAVARYNANGSLDSSFDSDGKLTTAFGSATDDVASSIAIDADGKIVVVGTSSGNFAIARYNANGSLDVSFDGDGKLTTDLGSYDQATSALIQADGKILVAGSGSNSFMLVRYNSDGSLDTSFDADGKWSSSFSLNAAQSVALQADGKILVAGSGYMGGYDSDFALVRLNADGSLDKTFDTDGMATANFGAQDEAYSIAVQADGKIVVVGGSAGSFAVARFNPDGSPDTTFSPPENTLDGNPAFTEYRYAGDAYGVVLDVNVQVADAELSAAGSYDGATLTLARHDGARAEDKFSSQGYSLSALVSGSYFSVDSITIGQVTTNAGGMLKLTFGAGATQALVNKAMQQIAYANTSDTPPATVQIDWTFSDGNSGSQGEGGALNAAGHTTVQITAVNDAPVRTAPIPAVSVAPNTALSFVIPEATFRDADGDILTYTATMADGTGMPPWLKFDAASHTFSGTPSATDVAALNINIAVTDPSGASAFASVKLTVATPNAAPTGSLAITGTPKQGATLTAVSTLADADGMGTLAYQWKAGGIKIAGATGSTLTLTDAQVGKAITVGASYVDGHGTAEAVASAATAVVTNPNGGPYAASLVFNFVGVLLENSPSYTVATGLVTQLYDAAGSQTINVAAGASMALVGATGANTVRLAGAAADWHAFHDGSTAIFVNDTGSRVEIAANLTAQSIQFDDQANNLVVDTSGAVPVVLLGTQSLGVFLY